MGTPRRTACLVVVVTVLAACSSGGETLETTTTTTTEPTTTSTAASTTSTTLPPTTTTSVPEQPATELMLFVQVHLQALGYLDGPPDGIQGPLTTAAIREFQTDAGITVDGEFGPQTSAALAAEIQGDSDFVEAVQEDLEELGLYSGPIDGSYGGGTEEAVRELQEDCGIEVDGAFTALTHVCLDRALS